MSIHSWLFTGGAVDIADPVDMTCPKSMLGSVIVSFTSVKPFNSSGKSQVNSVLELLVVHMLSALSLLGMINSQFIFIGSIMKSGN